MTYCRRPKLFGIALGGAPRGPCSRGWVLILACVATSLVGCGDQSSNATAPDRTPARSGPVSPDRTTTRADQADTERSELDDGVLVVWVWSSTAPTPVGTIPNGGGPSAVVWPDGHIFRSGAFPEPGGTDTWGQLSQEEVRSLATQCAKVMNICGSAQLMIPDAQTAVLVEASTGSAKTLEFALDIVRHERGEQCGDAIGCLFQRIKEAPASAAGRVPDLKLRELAAWRRAKSPTLIRASQPHP